jgi:cytoskeleton protein RodZ
VSDPELDAEPPQDAAEHLAPPTAGALLRAAREAAGMSIDTAAQQLKLAPRQVIAIENDDFPQLPGRTFIRGFTRNYARLLRLDVDATLAALPGEGGATVDRPSLSPTPRAMGEIPIDAPSRPSFSRWAIPLALVAVVAVAAWYEFARPQAATRRSAADKSVASAPVTGTIVTPLANPVTTDTAPVPAPRGEPVQKAEPFTSSSAPASTSANAIADTLGLSFRGNSWVEVKDRNGQTILSFTGASGTTQSVNGAIPLDVTIGNAPVVSITFRGQPVDLAPHTKQNVAHLRLPQ